MDECIGSLGDLRIFITLDFNSGYWEVGVGEPDRDREISPFYFRLYRFPRMPFGLRNAAATFQRAIDITLSEGKWQFALIYLDEVIIYSKTFVGHTAHVRTVMRLMEATGITPRVAKCAVFETTVVYLGHVIRLGRP